MGNVKTLVWHGDSLELIDQRVLPFEEKYVRCLTASEVADAIRDMVVRGAPAIGVTAAYGAALAAVRASEKAVAKTGVAGVEAFLNQVAGDIKVIAGSRPTAVNLFWALERMEKKLNSAYKAGKSAQEITGLLVAEAVLMEKEDVDINKRIGSNGAGIFAGTGKKLKVLTHCNAGALATAGYGTSLGVIRSLYSSGKIEHVLVDETRPYLQGARLTAWELYMEGIPFFVITDNMSGYFMSKKEVDFVVVGADRIAANGDTANKIGTLTLSIIASYYSIPFFIAAPLSTIDIKTKNAEMIPIEQRPEKEVRQIGSSPIIPDYMPVLNPSFDVTPNSNISAIITEEGVIYPPFTENIANIFKAKDLK